MANYALTAETQYADIDNIKMAYRKFGNGAPLILANRFKPGILKHFFTA